MNDFNNVKFEIDQFIKVIGVNNKNNNGIYKIEKQYDNVYFYCRSVNTDGTHSKAKYNSLFLTRWLLEKNPEIKIEVITADQLKQATKEVKAFSLVYSN